MSTNNTNSSTSLSLSSLEVAKTQLGLEEIPKGSNWGTHVKKYLASVNIDFPASWCMAFVYWCVNEACIKKEVKNPLIKTGGVLDLYSRIDPKFKVKRPEAGDIFIMDFGKGKGHTGFVEYVAEDSIKIIDKVHTINRIYTIEGNSNADGSREGYEVCKKPNGRPISSIKGFIRVV